MSTSNNKSTCLMYVGRPALRPGQHSKKKDLSIKNRQFNKDYRAALKKSMFYLNFENILNVCGAAGPTARASYNMPRITRHINYFDS